MLYLTAHLIFDRRVPREGHRSHRHAARPRRAFTRDRIAPALAALASVTSVLAALDNTPYRYSHIYRHPTRVDEGWRRA
jgi:hypothetical protein